MTQATTQIAENFRQVHGLTGGVVLIFNGVAYGWKNKLRDPQCEQPGAIAIDESGNHWLADGGDSYNGAERWELAREEAAP